MKMFYLIFGALIFTSNISYVNANLIVDQEHTFSQDPQGDAVTTYQHVAQTFTVGIGGQLEVIELALYRQPDATGTFSLNLLPTIGGVPVSIDEAIFSQTYDISYIDDVGSFLNTPNYLRFDISFADFFVKSGDVLAIALTHSGAGFPDWIIWNKEEGYNGGQSFLSGGVYEASWHTSSPVYFDNGFRTFVRSVPAPSTFAMLIICLLVITLRRTMMKR